MGPRVSRNVVKRGELLDALEAEAGMRYDQTSLARRAVRSRRRLAWLLAAGAVALLVEAVVGARGWLLGVLALAVLAWGAREGRLAAIIGAAFASVLFVALAIWALSTASHELARTLTLVLSIGYGLAMLPDIVLLVRDAELQHTFGMWARRGDR